MLRNLPRSRSVCLPHPAAILEGIERATDLLILSQGCHNATFSDQAPSPPEFLGNGQSQIIGAVGGLAVQNVNSVSPAGIESRYRS
jgi:hypothetical protein